MLSFLRQEELEFMTDFSYSLHSHPSSYFSPFKISFLANVRSFKGRNAVILVGSSAGNQQLGASTARPSGSAPAAFCTSRR